MSSEMRLFVLTCAITPGEVTPSLVLRDPVSRRNDYLNAARKWAQVLNPETDHVLVVENTGSTVDDLLELFQCMGVRSFAICYKEAAELQSSGKGNAEAAMFDRVVDWYLATDTIYGEIFKITGRLFVENFEAVCHRSPQCRENQIVFRARVRVDRTQVDTRFFSASPHVWQSYLTGLSGSVVESDGVFLEHAVARQLASAVFDGVAWFPFSQMPRIVGVSGSTGLRYGGLRERVFGRISSLFTRLFFDQYL
jgi:hypothetical protein